MNKRLNKKGFTLIELLAVIVVLALIMVLALPSILTTMNGAKKTTFQMFGQKAITAVIQVYESDQILGTSSSNKKYNSQKCYTLDDLMGAKGHGDYKGFIVVNSEDTAAGSGNATFKVYIKDSEFIYNGIDHSTILDKSAPQTIKEAEAGEAKPFDENACK